jgi:hypothetical protein
VTAQDKTIGRKPAAETVASKHKVMLIPFEPRLYFGEVDRSIHEETQLSSRQIRNKFRDGLNEQLYKAFRAANYTVLDLMDDTVKYRKDLEGIYQYLAYDYVKVPDQDHYRPPGKEKEEKKIEKGQLAVETNSDLRFMNARITSPGLVSALRSKHKTDVFVFINQLDIRSAATTDPTLASSAGNRKITVHYTVFTADGTEINSGIAEEEFSPELNNPKKVIDRHFSRIASTITKRVSKKLGEPPVK